MTPDRDDPVVIRASEPSFGEIDDWLFKWAIVLGVIVFLYIIVLGAGTFPWILIRFGWTNP